MGKARNKLSGTALAEFNAKHPRGPGGRFIKGGGGGGGAPSVPDAASAPTPGRARARLGLASKVDMPTALETLRAKKAAPKRGDREAVDAILKPMTHAQLDEVAREHGMDSFTRGTKEQKIATLREGLVGARLDRDAISRVSLGSSLPSATREEADAFFAQRSRAADRLRAADPTPSTPDAPKAPTSATRRQADRRRGGGPKA